jgi:triosephosphate isomerase
MRRTLIAGNWKMNGSLAANAHLLTQLKQALPTIDAEKLEVLVCVPAPYLAQCQQILTGSSIVLGAQDVSAQKSGAYTGEVAASMLTELGCAYVIVGHSERRAYHGETDVLVAEKAKQALSSGVRPVVCVGETLAQREAGQTALVVQAQLQAVLDALSDDELLNVVVAYEPVWAIGTGKTATPEMAQEVHAVLRAQLRARSEMLAEKICILYGGSMKPDNAKELLAMVDVDGGLIGGAALKAEDFLAIIAAV